MVAELPRADYRYDGAAPATGPTTLVTLPGAPATGLAPSVLATTLAS